MFCFSFNFQWSATEEDRVVPLNNIPPWSQSPSWICNALHMTFLCFPKSACKGKKDFFLNSVRQKSSKSAKKREKSAKKPEKSAKKTLHLFPHILRFIVFQMKDFLTVYGFMVSLGTPLNNFFWGPPLKKYFGDSPKKSFCGTPPKKVFFWSSLKNSFFGDPTPKSCFVDSLKKKFLGTAPPPPPQKKKKIWGP